MFSRATEKPEDAVLAEISATSAASRTKAEKVIVKIKTAMAVAVDKY